MVNSLSGMSSCLTTKYTVGTGLVECIGKGILELTKKKIPFLETSKFKSRIDGYAKSVKDTITVYQTVKGIQETVNAVNSFRKVLQAEEFYPLVKQVAKKAPQIVTNNLQGRGPLKSYAKIMSGAEAAETAFLSFGTFCNLGANLAVYLIVNGAPEHFS